MAAPSPPPSSTSGARVRLKPPMVFFPMALLGLGLKWVVPLPAPFAAVVRFPAGAVMVFVGLVLHVATMAPFRRTGQNPLPGNPAPELILEGPYRFSRNPMYLSVTLWLFGLSLSVDDLWIALAASTSLLIVHFTSVLPEEAYLQQRFGDAYLAYKSRVRRYL